MAKIHVLDNSLINKIAAGEVVERPASVVKELVENSVDAGATAVTVEIQNGGISLVKIVDNGKGIPAEEIETAFLRHATSKLNTFEDLSNMLTLGFRGEALSSIASVAQVEMTTKTQNDEMGTKITLEGGKMLDKQPCAATVGTVFVVKNLFFNTPARRKFLKKPATESGYISDIIYRIALGHPEIAIKFINNGNTVFQTNGNGDLKTAVLYIYGNEMAQALLPVEIEKNGYRVSGLIGKPELNRGNRNYESFFINGRYIKSNLISQSIEDAYKGRLMVGKFPVFMLNMTVPPDTVDVNVHPTKLEARFQNENFIYDLLYAAVSNTLKNAVLIPKVEWDSKPKREEKPITPVQEQPAQSKTDEKEIVSEQEPKIEEKPAAMPLSMPEKLVDEDVLMLREPSKKAEKANFSIGMQQAIDKIIAKPAYNVETAMPVKKAEQQDFLDKIDDNKRFFNNYKIVGQLFNTYWIIEQGNSMYLIDQHAAHERALYEQLIAGIENDDSPVSQLLLQPLAVSVTPQEAVIIEENRPLLESFGFELEKFGEGAYALRAVPFIFDEPSGAGFFREILDILQTQPVQSPYQARLDAIATISCKAAVKGNDRLSFSEAKDLIEAVLSLENPFSCPHGRPTIIEMTKYELEKKFKRIQG